MTRINLQQPKKKKKTNNLLLQKQMTDLDYTTEVN